MRRQKIVYIGFAFQHHKGTHAGYQHIKEYVDYDYVIDAQPFFDSCNKDPRNLFDRMKRGLFRRIFGSPVIPYFILKCIWLNVLNSNLVFHFIYGENTYLGLSRFLRPRSKIVCTFHQPINWFANEKWHKRLRSIDNIILVGHGEVRAFEKITGKSNICFIPHGISTDFYKPQANLAKQNIILTVGNWLRDYTFANTVYQQLLNKYSDLDVVIVASQESVDCINDHPRLHKLCGITDNQLLNLYQKCSVLFLPLIRFTANNSLLEASACGCRIVIATDSQDVSYIPSQMIYMCSMKLEEVLGTIEKAQKEPYSDKLANYIRKNYSWEIVGKMTSDYLRNVC